MRARVLVVDDDALIRKVSQRSLARAGFQVAVAGSVAEALGPPGAAAGAFDAAILDYVLGPRECGCDLIAPLRAANPSIRIAILSGLGGMPDLVDHAHRAGADLVAAKPHINWPALARGETGKPPARLHPSVDLDALRREAIPGTYLVHRRNITSTARALGMKRTSLQRILRKTPPPKLDDDE